MQSNKYDREDASVYTFQVFDLSIKWEEVNRKEKRESLLRLEELLNQFEEDINYKQWNEMRLVGAYTSSKN